MGGPRTLLLPWDQETIAARALDILRINAGGIDAARVEAFVADAVELCETFIDPCVAWDAVPPPCETAAVNVTIELYRRKDAPFGVTNAWSDTDYGPVRIGSDWLNSVRYLLLPYKCGWGIG